MPKTPSKLPRGATPGKIALIVVLAVVFVVVLVVQFGGALWSSPEVPESAAVKPRSARPAQRAAAGQTRVSESLPAVRQAAWTKIELPEVLAHDPFAVPTGLVELLPPAPLPEETPGDDQLNAFRQREELRRQMLETLRRLGVKMILAHDGQPVALIGNRIVHVGDVIGEFRVVDINLQEGVVLEAIDEEP